MMSFAAGSRIGRTRLSRVISSRLFNFVTRFLTGLKLHDINCGLKGYRRQVVQELRLYGEMHRFIPVIARQRGFRIGELPIRAFSPPVRPLSLWVEPIPQWPL